MVKRLVSVPGAPCCTYFPDVTSTTVRVVWGPPKQPNGIITGYRVVYRERAQSPEYAIVDDRLGDNRRNFTVSNLQQNAFYVFNISARTELGWGEEAKLEVITIVNRGMTTV